MTRSLARAARPLILTIAAGLAFAGLLRYHHAKFEDGMVRSFQKQQLEASRSISSSIEESVAGTRRSLMLLAAQAEVRRLSPLAKDVLCQYFSQERETLDDLSMTDPQGHVLWSAAQATRRIPTQAAIPDTSAASRLTIEVPIQADNETVAHLRATVNMYRLAVRSLSKTPTAASSAFSLVNQSGEYVYSSRPPLDCRVEWSYVDEVATRERVGDEDLLSYVTGKCAIEGRAGLADILRQEDRAPELAAYVPIDVESQRFAALLTAPRAEVSIPIASHERVTYALIVALALLYFATGYTAYRSERAHSQLEAQRRQAAERASQAKGQFLAQMSHELRTPMNGVISMTELAIASTSEQERTHYLTVVRDCAYSLLRLVNDILDMSKIEARKLALCRVPLNLAECAASAMAFLAPMADKKGLSLSWEVDAGVASIALGDPVRLRQVLDNLVGNAIKFTTQGRVALRITPVGATSGQLTVRFSVSDTGPGMTWLDQQRIFAAFEQSSQGAYRRDSSGLGLAIARQLVELMGGDIQVRSEIGKGTEFIFTISLCAMKHGSEEPADLPSLHGRTALAVCAGDTVTRQLTDFCVRHGVKVVHVTNHDEGRAALRRAVDRQEGFDLVICDSSGHYMDALDVAYALRDTDGQSEPARVVMYSGSVRGEGIRCLHAGADAYLGLPAEDHEILMVLRLALQHAADRGQSLFAPRPSTRTQRAKVLVVDDNPVNRQAASLMLARWGHDVSTANCGEEALSLVADHAFDLVLMDLEMPGISGIEATAQIRQREAATGRRTPIVAMTAHAMEADRDVCLKSDMDGYVSKPCRPDRLRALVARFAPTPPPDTLPAPVHPTQAPAAAAEKAPAWDRDAALGFVGGNEKSLELVVAAFLKDLRQVLPLAQTAAVARDAVRLAALAHRLKGSLGLLGATPALTCVVRLEQACQMQEPERLLEHFEHLHHALGALEAELSHDIQETTKCTSS